MTDSRLSLIPLPGSISALQLTRLVGRESSGAYRPVISRKLSIELEKEALVELHRLARAEGAEPERYAASLLTDLLRLRQAEAREATELLRGMPGALDDALEGSAQARRGESTALDSL